MASLLDLMGQTTGQTGRTDIAPDMHVYSSLLGGASSIGNPTYEQILASLPTSGSDAGTQAAQQYANRLFGAYYTPGGSPDLSDAGQAYVHANNINYTGGGGSGNNWYPGAEPNLPAGQASSGFTIGGKDPFAGQSSVGGIQPWNIARQGLNQMPWQMRNVLGPAVVRNVLSQTGTGKAQGQGTDYPGSVSYAPFLGHPPTPPQGEGQWTGNQARDAWGRLLGAYAGSFDLGG